MGVPLVSRNWTRDRKELEYVFRGIKQRMWLTVCYVMIRFMFDY